MKTKQRLLLAAVNLAIIALAFGWHYKPGVRAKITSAYALMAFPTTVPVQLTATGGTPITWSVTGGALPPGLSLASDTGIISGTPTLAGTYTFTATATNLVGSDSKAFTIRVNPAGCFVTTTSLPGAVTSTAYSQPLNQSGCAGSWSISSGSLPPGLSLNTTTGVISGTPTGTGTSSFTVTIGSDTQTLSIVVAAAGSCAITATSLPGAIDGTSYSQTPASSGCSGTWSISSGALPPGLSLNSSTGAITGTPTTAGTYSFTVANGSASRPLSILVNASCSITTTAFATGAAGSSYSQALGEVGCSGSWSATGLPSGFSISGSSIIGSPSAPSISTVTIAIGTASKTLTLTIGAAIGGYDGNIDISQMQTRVLSAGLDAAQFVTTDGSTRTAGDPLVWDSNGNAIAGSFSGAGIVSSVTASSPLSSSGGTTPNISITVPLPVADGGTGSTSPALVAGAGITITGSWPGQTIAEVGTVTNPSVRGFLSQQATASSFTVSWPTGTVAGDFAVIIGGSAFNWTVPSGWTSNDLHNGSTWNGIVCSKVLTSGDISTGHVTLSAAGSFSGVVSIVTFVGATGGVREVDVSNTSAISSATVTTSSAVQSGDAALYFGSGRQASDTCSVSRGTSLQTLTDTVTFDCLSDEAISASGSLSATYTFTPSAVSNGEYSADVIVEGAVSGGGNITSVPPPGSHTAPCTPNQVSYDASGNFYWCYAANSWARTGSGGYSNSF